MKKLFLIISAIYSTLALGQASPTMGINDVYKTTLSISWTVPSGATAIEVERATNRDFTSSTQIYSGISSQLIEQSGLTENSWYYFRARASYSGVYSSWVIDSTHTFWTPWAWDRGGNRIATSADLSLDPDISVGDFLIVGATHGYFYDSSGGSIQGLVVPALAAGKKVRILGWLWMDLLQLDMSNNVGTAASPYYITNTGGQYMGKLYIGNAVHCIVTGQYSTANKTGYHTYRGFDDPNNWNKLSRTFGLYAKGVFTDFDFINSSFTGSNVTFEYAEVGSGGYSGVTLKDDATNVTMDSFYMHHLYIHDTGGEGFYIGRTTGDPKHAIEDFTIENVVTVRNGMNGIQIGQMRKSNIIRNNVVVNSGYKWNNNQLGANQDQAIQFGVRENGFVFRNNIVAGSAGEFLNWFMVSDTTQDHPLTSQTSTVNNNVFIDSKQMSGGYVTARSGFHGTTNNDSNYYGYLSRDTAVYFVLYPWLNYPRDKVLYLQDASGGATATFNASTNTYDNTITSGGSFADSPDPAFTVTGSGNTRLSTNISRPVFNNYMDGLLDNDFSASEQWVSTQMGTATLRTYKLNDIVRYNGRFFKSLQNNNTSHQPTGVTDSYWQLLIFSNGRLTPPDDVRLVSNNLYARKQMGLTYKVAKRKGIVYY